MRDADFLATTIRSFVKTWGAVSAAAINEGDCEDFAEEVVRDLVARGILKAIVVHDGWFTVEGDPEGEGFWRHCWIYFEGKHYDSETPKGVDDWMKLPFFERCVKLDAEKFPQEQKIGRIGTKQTERKRLTMSVKAMVRVREDIASLKT